MKWDILFSLGINASYFFVLLLISKYLVKIGGSGDAGMIWLIALGLVIIQSFTSIIVLMTLQLLVKQHLLKLKILFYAVCNLLLPLFFSYMYFMPVFENNPYIHFNLIAAVLFIWAYRKKLERIYKA